VMIKLFSIIFLSFLTSVLRAQTSEYEQLKFEYERFRKEQKLDSIKLVAKEMNRWAFIHEGDTSLRYAVSFRYIGNGFRDLDSALYYYELSADRLRNTGRIECVDFAAVLSNIGGILISKREYPLAEKYLNESYNSCLNFKDHPVVKMCEQNLIRLYANYAFDLFDAGNLKESEVLFIKALDCELKLHGADSEEYLRLCMNIAYAYGQRNLFQIAVFYFETANELIQKNEPLNQAERAALKNGYGYTLLQLNKLEESIKLFRESLEIKKEMDVRDEAEIALTMRNLAMALKRKKEFRSSLEIFNDALLFYQKRDRNVEAAILTDIADIYDDLSQFEIAEEYYQSSDSIYNQIGLTQGGAVNLLNYGTFLVGQNRLDEASHKLYTSYGLFKNEFPDDIFNLRVCQENLAVLEFRKNNFVNAKRYSLLALSNFDTSTVLFAPGFNNMRDYLGLIYKKEGNLDSALFYYSQIYSFYKIRSDTLNTLFVRSLSMHGHIYDDLKMATEAESYHLRASLISREIHGLHTKASNFTKLDLALFYEVNKFFDKAELVYKERVPTFEITATSNDENCVEAILDLSDYFLRREMYDSSLHYLRLPGLEESLNTNDSKQLLRYFNLNTRAYLRLNDFNRALDYALKAQVMIDSDSSNFSDDDRLRVSSDLYNVYNEGCKYDKALEVSQSVLGIVERKYGNQGVEYVHQCFKIIALFVQLDDANNAISLIHQCLDLTDSGANGYCGISIRCHLGLAVIYSSLCDYNRAMNHLSIIDTFQSCDSTFEDFKLSFLTQMAEIKYAMNDYKGLQQTFDELYKRMNWDSTASDIGTKLSLFRWAGYLDLGSSKIMMAKRIREGMDNVADISNDQKLQILNSLSSGLLAVDRNMSLEFSRDALALAEATYGRNSYRCIWSLFNMASIYGDKADTINSDALYMRVFSIYDSLDNVAYSDYMDVFYEYFTHLMADERMELASENLNKYLNLLYTLVDENRFLGLESLRSYKEQLLDYFMVAQNAIVQIPNSDSLKVKLFNGWLLHNGMVNNLEAIMKHEVMSQGSSELLGVFEEYKRSTNSNQRNMLSASSNGGLIIPFNSNQDYDNNNLERALDTERMESILMDGLKKMPRLNFVAEFVDLQSNLALDEVYLDIVRIPYFDFEFRSELDSTFYIVYIVTSETRNAPFIVNLGDGKQIDEILYPYLVGQTTNPTSATMDGQVYDLLWKPLEEHLAGKTKIYLSPGGIYHSINPETIYHAETGKYLFEEKEIHLVNSGRSFVDQRIYGNRDYADKTALIMGAPNFDFSYMADSTLLEDNVSFTYQTMRDLSLDGNRRAAPLPATRPEVEGINQTLTRTAWNTQLLTGNDAMESNLKQMQSPRILHIATHGYFLEDVKPENDNGMRMMGMDVQRVAENPMLRSGLLLAGCNKTLADNTPLTGADNGILTAYEAGLLDLSKTELVVLSACETGKGEILNGEGVQGLRKAMTDAGAEHILMSLWKVDDKVTSEYMQIFYGHYAQGKSIRESYSLTRNEIKQKYPQPYYWGAFVLVGE